ncbi:hypothetical protein [Clostridium sp.]|nr:hypothetical protein [Clostridium sp.]
MVETIPFFTDLNGGALLCGENDPSVKVAGIFAINFIDLQN